MIINIDKFLLDCYKKKEMNKIDICFANLFKECYISMLFASISSLSNRLGHICLPIEKILSRDIFSEYILKFLFYFFSLITINNCLKILFYKNIISSSFQKKKTPLIFNNNCIYIYKFWFYENYFIYYLKKNINKNINLKKKYIFKLKKFLINFKLDIYQSLSIISSIINRITIISGGPGTGKTTLIVKLVIILYKLFNFKNKNYVRIVTPTGKSSACLTNYLNKIYQELKLDKKLIKILPNRAITIHKLLGFNYYKNNIKYNINNKLNICVLIIDESSMIDLSTSFFLFSSLYSNTKIIFVGDCNQIGSVEAGSIFNEICNKNTFFFKENIYLKKILNKYFLYLYNKKYFINVSNIFFLKKNYRVNKNSYLLKISNYIKNSYIKKIDKFIKKKKIKVNFDFFDLNKFNYFHFFNFCIKMYIKYINKINNIYNLCEIFSFFNKFQLICILKDTKFGVNFLNKNINNYLLKNNLVNNICFYKIHNCYHYLGEPIIINKNNSDLCLNNGDIGIFMLNSEKNLNVIFLNYVNNIKNIHINSLPNWENVWSITVHKSQGSEFDHVLLLLPNFYIPILNKNLIYTAITRAKKKVTVYAYKEIFLKSIISENINYNNIKKNL